MSEIPLDSYQLEVGTHEQHSLEGGTHEPTPPKVLNVIRGWTFVRASLKCRLFVKVNFSMAWILKQLKNSKTTSEGVSIEIYIESHNLKQNL